MAEEQQTELGVWVDQLLKDIFFQPDDELAKRAMLTGFSPQLKVKYVLKSLLSFHVLR